MIVFNLPSRSNIKLRWDICKDMRHVFDCINRCLDKKKHNCFFHQIFVVSALVEILEVFTGSDLDTVFRYEAYQVLELYTIYIFYYNLSLRQYILSYFRKQLTLFYDVLYYEVVF